MSSYTSPTLPDGTFADIESAAALSGLDPGLSSRNGAADLLDITTEVPKHCYDTTDEDEEVDDYGDYSDDDENERRDKVGDLNANASGTTVDFGLTARTSEILSDYRAYINEMEKELGDVSRLGKDQGLSDVPMDLGQKGQKGKDHEQPYRDFPDHHLYRSAPVMRRGEAGMGRDWTEGGELYDASFGPVEESLAYKNRDISPGAFKKRRSYKHSPPMFQSNRAKLAVVCVLVVGVAIGALIGTFTATRGNNNVLQAGEKAPYYDVAPDNDLHLPPKVIETIQGPPVQTADNVEAPEEPVIDSSSTELVEASAQNADSSSTETGTEAVEKADASSTETAESPQQIVDSSSTETTETSEQTTTTSSTVPKPIEDPKALQFTTLKFKPVAFDRAHDWNGKTYDEAIKFCAAKDSRIPCPYEAICPLGAHGVPFGGYREEPSGTWFPIMDSPNAWVQVGEKDSCMKYDSIHNGPPSWGLSGENSEEITRYIMCCKDLKDDETSQPKDSQEVIETRTASEQKSLDDYHPLWFGPRHGYIGGTHAHAEEFCNNVGDRTLCPVEAYCPDGPKQSGSPMFLQNTAFRGQQWAPVSTGDSWVFVGTQVRGKATDICSLHEQLFGKSPAWGDTDTNSEIKQNVMCCTKNDKKEKEVSLKHQVNFVWVDEDHGWKGGSYDDAVSICAGIERKICPLEVYCPHGSGRSAIGGHKSDFNSEGVQWAPIHSKGGNQWVMIGQKYGNSATTCMTYPQLEGKTLPDWGLSSEKAYTKKHLLCCAK